MSTTFDHAVSDNPIIRAGLDAWCLGFSASMLLGLGAMRMVSEAQVSALSALLDSTTAAATTPNVKVAATPLLTDARSAALKQRDHELLVAVLPQDDARDAPLRMYPGSLDVVPWRYDK